MSLNKEISPKQRKVIGIIMIAAGVIVGLWSSFILGAVILLVGLWVFNPGKAKDKTV